MVHRDKCYQTEKEYLHSADDREILIKVNQLEKFVKDEDKTLLDLILTQVEHDWHPKLNLALDSLLSEADRLAEVKTTLRFHRLPLLATP